jgi:lipopolysaccharide export system protein LptA
MPRIDRHSAKTVLLGLMLAAMAAGPALSQDQQQGRLGGLKLSGDQPIQIESDKLEVREADSMAIFSGNVSVVQGPTLLKAGKMTVYYAKDGGGSATTGSANIDRLEVEDKVFVKSETQTATGDKGSFDMKTEVLNLTGKEVVLTEGENVLTGCSLTANMKTGLAELGACGGRVKTLLTPSSQQQSQ